MPGHMRILHDHLCMLHIQFINDLIHSLFIARNRMRGHNHHIVWCNADLTVHAACHAGQSRHGLSLGAGRNQYGFFIRIVLKVLNINERALRDLDVLKLLCHTYDVDHGTSLDHNLPVIFCRRIDDLLYTVYIGGKSCHNDPVITVLSKDPVKGCPNRALRHSKARLFCIGGVGQHCNYAILSKLCKSLEINRVAENRGVVDLKISRMDKHTGRCIDCKRCRVLNRVIGLYELDLDIPKIYGRSELHNLGFYKLVKSTLHKLTLDQRNRQSCSIYWNIDLLQHIGQCADMVLMSMCNNKSLNLMHMGFKIRYIWDDQVNAQHIVRRERETAVNNDNAFFRLDRRNVHANLIQTTQRDNFYTSVIFHFYRPGPMSSAAYHSVSTLRLYLGFLTTLRRLFEHLSQSHACCPSAFSGSRLSASGPGSSRP